MIFLIGTLIPLIVPNYDAMMLSRIITGLAGGIIMPQCDHHSTARLGTDPSTLGDCLVSLRRPPRLPS